MKLLVNPAVMGFSLDQNRSKPEFHEISVVTPGGHFCDAQVRPHVEVHRN